jgi:hypothetical protein
MFVGISVSELLGWYWPVVGWVLPIFGVFIVVCLVGIPILDVVWAFIERNKYTLTLTRKVACLLDFNSPSVYRVDGKPVHNSYISVVERILEDGVARVVEFVNSPSPELTGGYADYHRHCISEKVKKSRITRQKSCPNDRPLWSIFLDLTVFSVALAMWPALVVAASIYIPLYLLRAARDGQKLAVKVSKHIADKEAHNEGSSDSSSSN